MRGTNINICISFAARGMWFQALSMQDGDMMRTDSMESANSVARRHGNRWHFWELTAPLEDATCSK